MGVRCWIAIDMLVLLVAVFTLAVLLTAGVFDLTFNCAAICSNAASPEKVLCKTSCAVLSDLLQPGRITIFLWDSVEETQSFPPDVGVLNGLSLLSVICPAAMSNMRAIQGLWVTTTALVAVALISNLMSCSKRNSVAVGATALAAATAAGAVVAATVAFPSGDSCVPSAPGAEEAMSALLGLLVGKQPAKPGLFVVGMGGVSGVLVLGALLVYRTSASAAAQTPGGPPSVHPGGDAMDYVELSASPVSKREAMVLNAGVPAV